MSRSETLGPEAEIRSLKAERDYLRGEIERYAAMEKAVQELKSAYESQANIASRSRNLRDAIMKVIGL